MSRRGLACAVIVAFILSGCSRAIDRPGESVGPAPTAPVPQQSVENVLGCGSKGLAQLYWENGIGRDEWTTAEQAAVGLGRSMLGARSPEVRPWSDVSTLDVFSHSADSTTWVVYQGAGSPLGVVQVVPTLRGENRSFMGNVVARCFQ